MLALFSTSAIGLRAFSGITVGLLGSITNIHLSLAASGLAFAAVAAAPLLRIRRVART